MGGGSCSRCPSAVVLLPMPLGILYGLLMQTQLLRTVLKEAAADCAAASALSTLIILSAVCLRCLALLIWQARVSLLLLCLFCGLLLQIQLLSAVLAVAAVSCAAAASIGCPHRCSSILTVSCIPHLADR